MVILKIKDLAKYSFQKDVRSLWSAPWAVRAWFPGAIPLERSAGNLLSFESDGGELAGGEIVLA
jgi:hypothetical protein